jgi:flagellar biosynthetic protein FliR
LTWDLQQIVIQALFVAARIGTLMTFAPFFGNIAIPARVKAGLTLMLTFLLYPIYGSRVTVTLTSNWPLMVGGELLIGMVIGLALNFVFEGVQLAGQILGFQLGFSLANIIDPQSQVETTVLSTFHQLIALLIFLELGVHQWILRALGRSFEYLPIGATIVTLTTANGLVHMAGGMLLIAVQIGAPGLLATLLADFALALLGRASPQLPVTFIGISAKALIGYAILLAAVAFWPGLLETQFTRAIASAEHLLRLAS